MVQYRNWRSGVKAREGTANLSKRGVEGASSLLQAIRRSGEGARSRRCHSCQSQRLSSIAHPHVALPSVRLNIACCGYVGCVARSILVEGRLRATQTARGSDLQTSALAPN
jgi:hypothetical protein